MAARSAQQTQQSARWRIAKWHGVASISINGEESWRKPKAKENIYWPGNGNR